MKDAYYFPHDSNARHDPRMIALCSEFGLIAYAYYFQLIEILREQDSYELDECLGSVITTAWQSYGNAIAPEKASQTLTYMITLKLIEKVDGKIFSPSLMKRMAHMDDLRRKRSEAGKRGAMAKWQTDGKPMAVKERKVKESKDLLLNPPNPLSIPDDLKPNESEILDWLLYKKQKGQIYKPKGLEALWRAFRAIPQDRRRESVDHSMSNNWSGLFQKNGGNNGRKPVGAEIVPGKYGHLS